MKTIALETSAVPGSLALLEDAVVIYETSLPEQQRTTQTFAVELTRALRQAGWRPSDVDLFAVCQGPGSFTGLRIGVTAAKTFAYATGCHVIGLNTLCVLAGQAGPFAPRVWAALDAQRRQLFVAEFECGADLPRELTATQVVDAEAWILSRPAGCHLTGTGLRGWESSLPSDVTTASETDWKVRAGTLGQMAAAQLAAGTSDNCLQLVPRYHRASAAEEKRGRGPTHPDPAA